MNPTQPTRSTTSARAAARFIDAGRFIALAIVLVVVALAGSRPHAQAPSTPPRVFISEVHPSGSSNGTYNADWFEVTNTGTTDVAITGWKIDDNSATFGLAVPMALETGSTIPAGKSAVFLEATAANPSTAVIPAFKMAWFGNNPPGDLLIGTYSGNGVGLSSTTDAVNIYNSSGTLITGVSFGAANATNTFDNTAGFGAASVSTMSAAGINGAFVSANGVEVGSPGKRVNASPITTIDLSLYVRTARFELPEPTRTPAPTGNLLAQEASAVTYDWDTDSLFVVGDGGTAIVQVTKTGQLIDTMTLAAGSSPQGTEFYDTEGLTYTGNGLFVMAEERYRQAVQFKYVPGTTLTRAMTKTVKLGTTIDNIGIEGISFDPQTAGYIAVKETTPEGIFQTGIDFNAGTATNGSPTTENSTNLFDPALAGLSDFADVFALSNIPTLSGSNTSRILIDSQEAAKIVNIDRTGVIANALRLTADPGDTIAVPDMQPEGITMDWNGTLYVVSENGGGDINHPQLWIYKPATVPNQAPTAVALANKLTSVAENTSTASRLKVGDIVITDDGLGTNQVALTGTDAGFFEVFNDGLYIKAGTVLDFETKTSYSVNVVVDDPTVGSTPDASVAYTLTITDVVNEGSGGSTAIIISEVAPWGSSASYLADWFEVTNVGATPVAVTNWKMDDNSNAVGNAVALNGVSSIAAGESVIFMETSTPDATKAAFLSAWFGANPPAHLQIGTYSGSGVGLSTSGDAINIFDASGNRITGVNFGTATTNVSFDNRAGIGSTALPLPNLSVLSAIGVGGVFTGADGVEIGSPGTVAAHVVITEIAPWASGETSYAADWFEVTNTGELPVDLAGWRMDDNSNSFGSSVQLRGVNRIPAGRAAVFMEGAADGSTDGSLRNAFSLAWTGASTLPAGYLLGFYGGGGVGLSTGGDAVNLFDATGARITGIAFPGATTGFSFDNTAGVGSTTLPLPVVAALNAVGVHNAFRAADGIEVGSPGLSVAATADDDGDGVSNAAEIGSGGSPAGNLLGSNPLNALSTPEVCDGKDNDLNEGVDEGFPDTDGDGVKNCVDLDDDDDGIADAVDPFTLLPTNETFSDALPPLLGTTSGRILTRNGHAVAIADATTGAPDTGVQVVVVGGPGTGPVQIQLDGKVDTISLPDGAYVVTDPSGTTTVTVTAGGPATITATLNGLPLIIIVGGGSSVTYTETPGASGLSGLSIDSVVGNVAVNGKPVTAPTTLVGPPLTTETCKDGGFQAFNFPGTFKNQGDCVSYVATGAKNAPAGR